MGNIIELCAAQLYPDPKTYLGFTMCVTRQYRRIPERELFEDCALEHAIDIKKLNDCAAKDDGAYGMHLLKSSVERTEAVRLRSVTPFWRLTMRIVWSCIRLLTSHAPRPT